jgi:hypothetical protein
MKEEIYMQKIENRNGRWRKHGGTQPKTQTRKRTKTRKERMKPQNAKGRRQNRFFVYTL